MFNFEYLNEEFTSYTLTSDGIKTYKDYNSWFLDKTTIITLEAGKLYYPTSCTGWVRTWDSLESSTTFKVEDLDQGDYLLTPNIKSSLSRPSVNIQNYLFDGFDISFFDKDQDTRLFKKTVGYREKAAQQKTKFINEFDCHTPEEFLLFLKLAKTVQKPKQLKIDKAHILLIAKFLTKEFEIKGKSLCIKYISQEELSLINQAFSCYNNNFSKNYSVFSNEILISSNVYYNLFKEGFQDLNCLLKFSNTDFKHLQYFLKHSCYYRVDTYSQALNMQALFYKNRKQLIIEEGGFSDYLLTPLQVFNTDHNFVFNILSVEHTDTVSTFYKLNH